jgi:Reverse transcriptase (RNA-dependent DNA polymerase)
VLLNLSAAFDTVDYIIMLKLLERTFRGSGVALDWLSSYLVDREHFVKLGADSSDTVTLLSGLPQGSLLGPLLFIMYNVDLIDVILSNLLFPYLYADDTLYGSSRPGNVSTLAARVAGSVKVVAD